MSRVVRLTPGVAVSKVKWNADERRSLAQRVAKGLLAQGVDPAAARDEDLAAMMMPLLRAAVKTFSPDRRREIAGASQVPWLAPLMREMVRASRGESDKFPRDVLAEKTFANPKPLGYEEPYYALENLPRGAGREEEDYYIPEGTYLVDERQWRHLNRQVASARRGVKAAAAKVDHLADQVAALVDLLLERADLVPEPIRPTPDDAEPVRRSGMPHVVVAGLRPGEHAAVEGRVGDLAEVNFLDATRKRPEDAGGCDWLVATRFCGRTWLRRAGEVYQGRLSVVPSTAEAVAAEIERLRS